VYATVAWGKKWSRSAQVAIMASWMRWSKGRQKWDVKREKPWPSSRSIIGVSTGKVKSNEASCFFIRSARGEDLSSGEDDMSAGCGCVAGSIGKCLMVHTRSRGKGVEGSWC
jgi:hypothetical protein